MQQVDVSIGALASVALTAAHIMPRATDLVVRDDLYATIFVDANA
jgi:hypothetical protein